METTEAAVYVNAFIFAIMKSAREKALVNAATTSLVIVVGIIFIAPGAGLLNALIITTVFFLVSFVIHYLYYRF